MANFVVCTAIAIFWVFFINSEGISIRKRSSCQNNEVEVECSHCGPKYCDDLGYPIPCSGNNGLCKPQCVCIDGYVRDVNETCIEKKKCPSCGGDQNATSGCGNYCGNTCSDYQDVNKTCLSGCRYNGCNCKTGYVYHEEIKKCILPIDCW